MFYLKIVFFGLVGFADGTGAQASMIAVLPVVDEHSAECAPTHYATVVLPQDLGTCASGAAVCEPSTNEGLSLKWSLDREQLSIGGTPVGGARFMKVTTNRVPGTDYPRTPSEAKDFSWVPSMSLLSNTDGRLAADCLGNPSGKCQQELVGRFVVDHGEARSCHVLHDELDNIGIFSFGIQGYQQAVADAVVVEAAYQDPEITLNSHPFSGGGPKRQAVLRPVWNSTTSRYEIVLIVVNTEDLTHVGGVCKALRYPKHPRNFYDLIASEPGRQPLRGAPVGLRKGDIGECEYWLETYSGSKAVEDSLKAGHVLMDNYALAAVPHNLPECDTRDFP